MNFTSTNLTPQTLIIVALRAGRTWCSVSFTCSFLSIFFSNKFNNYWVFTCVIHHAKHFLDYMTHVYNMVFDLKLFIITRTDIAILTFLVSDR